MWPSMSGAEPKANNMKTHAAARLKATQVTAIPSNSASSVLDEVRRQLQAGKYQVKAVGGGLQVMDGTIANVAGAMKYKGWTMNARKELHHPSVDYFIKLSEANGITTIRVTD